jgi:hypothetical protein
MLRYPERFTFTGTVTVVAKASFVPCSQNPLVLPVTFDTVPAVAVEFPVIVAGSQSPE